jgi:uncharacterized iron-regulated protein
MQVGAALTQGMLVLLFAASAGASDVRSEEAVVDTFIATAEDAHIVVLGEVHDNPAHHATQARIVDALQPAAIVFEMIPQRLEAELNRLRAEGADRAALATALAWDESGWPDFGYYASIMEAAPSAQIFGAGQPAEDVTRAMLEGAVEAFGPDAAIYGLDKMLSPEEQAERELIQAEAHCGALDPEMLPNMVEAQRFRDAGLADATLWARVMSGEGQVVVITGSGHADKKRGMPAMLALAEPEARVVTLGQFETGATEEGAAERFDAMTLAPRADRPDPCLAFAAPETE